MRNPQGKARWFFLALLAVPLLPSVLLGVGLAETPETFQEPKLVYRQFAYAITGDQKNEKGQRVLDMAVLNTETGERFTLTLTDYEVNGNGQNGGSILLGQDRYSYAWNNESGTVSSINYPGGITYPGEKYTFASETGNGRMIVPQDLPPDLANIYMLRGAVHAVEDFKWKPKGGLIAAGLFLAALGLWNAFSPRSVWYISEGWRYKDVEPSDLAISINRIIGCFSIIAGAIVLFLGIKG